MPTAAPLRDRLIGLPLQRSTFDQIDRLGELIGLGHALPGGRFDAHLDDEGNLHVATAHVEALRSAFPARPDPGFLELVEQARRSRCTALREAWTRTGSHEASASQLVAAVSELLTRVTDVMPYGLLSKFVPELLSDALVASGASSVPALPAPSPGAQLTNSLSRLAAWCVGQGVAGEDLARRWPDVDPGIRAPVEAFCSAHAGFGPVAWEAPGFDDPRFTLRAIAGLGALPGAGRAAPVFEDLTPADDQARDLAGALAAWQEFTEHQIWYVRTAFHRGIAPLLRRLAASVRVAPHRLLFLTRHEIAGDWPSDVEIDHRVTRYMADTAYLHRHSIAPDRPVEMLRERA